MSDVAAQAVAKGLTSEDLVRYETAEVDRICVAAELSAGAHQGRSAPAATGISDGEVRRLLLTGWHQEIQSPATYLAVRRSRSIGITSAKSFI